MTLENRDSIHRIIDTVEIDPDRRLFHQQVPFSLYEPGHVSTEMLFNNLQQLIYTRFYSANQAGHGDSQAPAEIGHRHAEAPSVVGHREAAAHSEAAGAFVRRLREANTSKERWDRHWSIAGISPQGNFHVIKGNYARIAYSGEFIKEDFSQRHPQANDRIKLLARKEYFHDQQSFYFVFGQSMAEAQQEWLCRFYFNITPEGAAGLVAAISGMFNRYSIPFEFKCLSKPEDYTRTDAAVLYLENRYFPIGLQLLRSIYSDLSGYFRDACPLFTKKLAPGFAFAENPYSSGESFGTSRCGLIAKSILKAYDQGMRKDHWPEAVTTLIENEGFKLAAFYLNPDSHYPYRFEL